MPSLAVPGFVGHTCRRNMSGSPRVLPVLLLAVVLVGACADPVTGGRGAELRSGETATGPTMAPTTAPTSAAVVSPVPPPTPGLTPSPEPSPATSASPEPTPEPTPEPQAGQAATKQLKPYALNLYRRGDYVAQYTFEWCVGASLQMMLNLTDAADTRSRARQGRLWRLARDLSSSPFGGANPRGWTAALNELGIGPYELVSIPRYADALRVAAKALRKTGRPVGLVMWRGRHAWVMSGFTSDGDPRRNKRFRVTGIRVLDPLHPHGSSVWGASPAPNRLLTPKQLARQFVMRDSSRVNLGVPPGYLLVLPVS